MLSVTAEPVALTGGYNSCELTVAHGMSHTSFSDQLSTNLLDCVGALYLSQ